MGGVVVLVLAWMCILPVRAAHTAAQSLSSPQGAVLPWTEASVNQLNTLRELAARRYLYVTAREPGSPVSNSAIDQLSIQYTEFMQSALLAVTNWCSVVGYDHSENAFSALLRVLYGPECTRLLTSAHQFAIAHPTSSDSLRMILSQVGNMELLVLHLSRHITLTDENYRLIGSRPVSPSARHLLAIACRAANEVCAFVDAQWASGASSSTNKLIRDEHMAQSHRVKNALADVASRLDELLSHEVGPVEYGQCKVAFAERYMASVHEIKQMLRVEKYSPIHGSYFSLLGVFTYPVNPDQPAGAKQASYRLEYDRVPAARSIDVPLYKTGEEKVLVLESPRLRRMKENEAAIRAHIDFSDKHATLAQLENLVKAKMATLPANTFRVTEDLAGEAHKILASLPESDRQAINSALHSWMPSPGEIIQQHLSYFTALDEATRSAMADLILKNVHQHGFEKVYRDLVKARRRDLADYQTANKKEAPGNRDYVVCPDPYSGIPMELVYWQERYLDWKIAKRRVEQRTRMEMELTAHGYGWNGNAFHDPKQVVIKGPGQATFSGTDGHSHAVVASWSSEDRDYFTALGYTIAAKTVTETRLDSELLPGDHPDEYYNKIYQQLKLLPLSVMR